MKISAKTDYACRALLELALHWPPKEPLQIQEIARNQKIPVKFLTHILVQLKQSGYVESSRGQKGGYVLIKAPKDIRLGDVIRDFSNIEFIPKKKNKSNQGQVLSEIWVESEIVFWDYLSKITFEHIRTRQSNLKTVPMYAI